VGAGHAHPLYVDGDSPVHRLPPEVKIVSAFAVTVAVVATPREAFWAFGAYTVLLAGVMAVAGIRLGWLAKRAAIELPFVVLAVLLPFVGRGEQVNWLGMSLSVDGLYGAWNIFAKGTLGVIASLLLAATTPMRDLLLGLERLRAPQPFVQIATFMLRYLDVIGDQARRMRIARLSRGYDPGFIWQVRAFATSLGSLFIRSFERGERVYLAMVSRGYTGRMPAPGEGVATLGNWAVALCLPAAATLVTVVAWLQR
jgi:cobalt/nickel transport system permease protein